jgi:NADH-quinone oxidoreductase subunit H
MVFIDSLIDDDGTLSLREISAQQSGMNWNVLPTIIFPYIFNLCVCRNQSNSFDLAECETELMVDTIRSTPL